MHVSIEIVEQPHISSNGIDEVFCAKVADFVFSHFQNLVELEKISVCLVHSNDFEIQKLNKEFRNKDKPTNVLSFPLYEFFWKEFNIYAHPEKEIELGDIVFSIETLEREALEQGQNFKDYYIHLLVHSLLHLIGYDHEQEDDAEVMEELESSILASIKESVII